MSVFHPLISIKVRSYRCAFFLLKPAFAILLETVLLYSLKLLAEQHRIVAKIEEIMPMIERLTLR